MDRYDEDDDGKPTSNVTFHFKGFGLNPRGINSVLSIRLEKIKECTQ